MTRSSYNKTLLFILSVSLDICDRYTVTFDFLQIYFGSQHAKCYLLADIGRINCATGMSVLMRKSVLDEAGGLKAFGQYLAEDFFMAQAFLDR